MSRKKSQPIYKVTRKDGSVVYRVVVDVTPVGGRRKQQTTTHATMRDAQQYLSRVRSSLMDGTFIGKNTITVAQAVDEWLAGREGVRPNTLAGYKSALAPVIAEVGDLPLQKLTPARVVDVKNALRTTGGRNGLDGKPKGRSARTVNYALSLLGAVCEHARRQGVIPLNPVQHVERPQAEHAEFATWSPQQAQGFLSHVQDDRYIAAWRLTFCGLRRSEVLGLRWCDVDLDGGIVSIQQARTARKDATVTPTVGNVAAPKSRNSRRRIPVGPEAVAALRAFKQQQRVERLALGHPLTDDDLVVCDEVGFPCTPDWYSSLFQRHVRAAGLPRIRLHDVRHSVATWLHQQGTPTGTAAAYLGHDAVVFLRTYQHGEVGFGDVAASLSTLTGTGPL